MADRPRSPASRRVQGAPDRIWRVSAEYLETAQDDATLLAIREMEMEGVEVITAGEIRRESCSNGFATALDGVDIENPDEVTG